MKQTNKQTKLDNLMRHLLILLSSTANLFKDLPVIDGDDHLGELSIYDFVPHSVTALSQLLMNKENMQVSIDFQSIITHHHQRIKKPSQ